MGYDYTGYGPQPATPYQTCVSHSLADISAVFDHLLRVHELRPEDIILYGQSVGSGPTVGAAITRACQAVEQGKGAGMLAA